LGPRGFISVVELEDEKGQVMTNIVKFPDAGQEPPAGGKQAAPRQADRPTSDPVVLKVLWVVTVLLWPLLKWVVALDCVFQLLRTVYYWDTPGVHAGWTFFLHFAVLTALTYFVSIYKPRGL
jgi:hypothetical protein